jgi:hypothetical protein
MVASTVAASESSVCRTTSLVADDAAQFIALGRSDLEPTWPRGSAPRNADRQFHGIDPLSAGHDPSRAPNPPTKPVQSPDHPARVLGPM